MVLHYSVFYYNTNAEANQNTFSTYSHFITRKDKKKCRRLSYGYLSYGYLSYGYLSYGRLSPI